MVAREILMDCVILAPQRRCVGIFTERSRLCREFLKARVLRFQQSTRKDGSVSIRLRHTQAGGSIPRGDKSSYSSKQKRQAEHIEEGYEKRGTSKKVAEQRAWATVNKQTGGGKKSGSGRGKSRRSR